MGDGTTIGDDELSQRLGDQSHITGDPDHEVKRAGEGEGVRAPLAAEGADHAEFSIFDGKGNEQVVVVTENEEGKRVQATGDSSAEAAEKAGDQEVLTSPAFETNPYRK